MKCYFCVFISSSSLSKLLFSGIFFLKISVAGVIEKYLCIIDLQVASSRVLGYVEGFGMVVSVNVLFL